MIVQILSLVLWLLIIPFFTGIGLIKFMKIKEGKCCMTFISGYLFLLALFQIVFMAIIWKSDNLNHVIYPFVVIIGILTVLLILYGYSEIKSIRESIIKSLSNDIYCKIFWILVLLLIGFQLVMSIKNIYTDGDDAFYLAQSAATEASNKMYGILPYTGESAGIDNRRVISSFPVFIAFLGRVCNIHTTIIAHMILPLVLIPLMYLIYMQIGRVLLKENKNYIPLFMIIINLFYIFGNHSIYTNTTFAMTRTWQGKSLLANIMIPATFLGLLLLFHGKPKKGMILFFAMIILGGTAASTMGLLLIPLLLNIGIIMYAISTKFWRREEVQDENHVE